MASWRRAAYRAARPLLLLADPESIHQLTLNALAFAGRSGAGRALCRLASGAADPGLSRVELSVGRR